jgi:hypothetical protein
MPHHGVLLATLKALVHIWGPLFRRHGEELFQQLLLELGELFLLLLPARSIHSPLLRLQRFFLR